MFGCFQDRAVPYLSIPWCHLVETDTSSTLSREPVPHSSHAAWAAPRLMGTYRRLLHKHKNPPVYTLLLKLQVLGCRDTDVTGIQISVISVSLLNLLLNVCFHKKCYTQYFQRTNSILTANIFPVCLK